MLGRAERAGARDVWVAQQVHCGGGLPGDDRPRQAPIRWAQQPAHPAMHEGMGEPLHASKLTQPVMHCWTGRTAQTAGLAAGGLDAERRALALHTWALQVDMCTPLRTYACRHAQPGGPHRCHAPGAAYHLGTAGPRPAERPCACRDASPGGPHCSRAPGAGRANPLLQEARRQLSAHACAGMPSPVGRTAVKPSLCASVRCMTSARL